MTFWAYVIKEGKESIEIISVEANISEDKAFDLVESLLLAKGFANEDIYALERTN